MRGAPFLGWILVRGMWCADFGADFGARCGVFGLDFGARCTVFGLDFGARCVVCRFWGLGARRTVLRDAGVDGVHFVCVHSALCGVFFGCTVCLFGVFLVCGAPFLGSILVHGVWSAAFGADFGARCAFLGSILVRCLLGIDFGAWCADVGVDHSQRATRSIKIGEDLGGIEPETCRIWGLGPGA